MREFVGATLKDALEKACQYYNLASDEDLNYKMVYEKGKTSKVFGNLNRVVILAERKEVAEPINVKFGSVVEILEKFLSEFKRLSNLDIDYKFSERDDKVLMVKIGGNDAKILIGKDECVLNTMQMILYSIVKNVDSDFNGKILLDISNYRSNRESYLKDLALTLRKRVLKTRQDKTIPDLNAFERRIVHTTLEEFKDVATESIGDGKLKTVRIYIKNGMS